ncbi:MAG TPA: hypothetical protein VHU83_23485 [Bryobacteraceae bacterium]|jgi:hypothetical protein|nr:hypothetical protein [Bryobacteraceae bacterium]
MARREVNFDDETDQMLARIAENYEGDLSKALSELIHAHDSLETFVERCEVAHGASLREQGERAEGDFRDGRVVTWDEVKRHNGL